MEKRLSKVLLALYNQLLVSPLISYAKDGAYHSRDVWDIVQLDKNPFFVVVPSDPSKRMEKVGDLPKSQMKRHIYRLSIQYGVRAMKVDKAIMGDITDGTIGILDFQEDIWDAIEADPTLSGAVRGMIPNYDSIPFDMIQELENGRFMAGGQIDVEFYNDIVVVK